MNELDFENQNNPTEENNEEISGDNIEETPCESNEEVMDEAGEVEENAFDEISDESPDSCPCGLNSEEGVGESDSKKQKNSFLASVYEYAETFCYALAVMMVMFLFVFRYVTVDGDSMKHTLHHQDKLIISNLFYTPETGDIVVINPESSKGASEPIIKRVIATEGQTVLIDYENWEVYVDGVKLDEPYIQAMKLEDQRIWGENLRMNYTNVDKYKAEFTVGEGKVFVMGDNRNHSKDSRDGEYGEMGVNRILGRVIVRLSPDFGFVD